MKIRYALLMIMVQAGSIFAMEPKKGEEPRSGRPGVKLKRSQKTIRQAATEPQRPVRSGAIQQSPIAQPARAKIQPIQGDNAGLNEEAVAEECPICMSVKTQKRAPCCNQAICPVCWKKWQEQHKSCPFCRHE